MGELEVQKASRVQTRAACKASAEKMKRAWDEVRELRTKQAQAEADLAACKSSLKKFQAGPLATMTMMTRKATTALKAPQPITAEKKNESELSRRLSFAEVRRRR